MFSWMTRAPLVAVKRPKLPLVIVALTVEKLVWLKALNISARSCMRTRSVKTRFLAKVRSKFQNPGRRMAFLPSVPGRADAPLA